MLILLSIDFIDTNIRIIGGHLSGSGIEFPGMLLELVNYIQHYGLERKMQNGKYERFTDHHSWNSRHISANWSTFNLGLHAEHHQSA